MARAGILTAHVLTLVTAASVMAACRRPAPEAADASVSSPLTIDVSGCAAVVGIDPATLPTASSTITPPKTSCALADDRVVRVFVPAPLAATTKAVESTVTTAGKTNLLAPLTLVRHVPGGDLYKVQVPPDVTSIELRRGQEVASLFLQSSSPRPAWYAEAQSLRQKGKLDESAALANAALANPTASIAERAAAEGIVARIALRRGKIDEAIESFRAAIKDDERANLVSDRADDAFALTFVLHKRTRRYAEARQVLDEVSHALDRAPYADGRAREPLYRAQVAWETGDTRTATRELALSIERADRLGADGIARAARQVRAMVACTAGSTHACVTALREADRELEQATAEVPACERAEVEISLGFAELEEAELNAATTKEGTEGVGKADERALKLLETTCPDPYMRAVALEHLAMAAVLLGDPALAKKRLAEAKTFAKEPRISDAVMWLDIEGHIHELESHPDAALTAFDNARSLARGAAQRAAYKEAEALLDEVVAMVPFGEGRSSAAADGGESVRRAASILIDEPKKLPPSASSAARTTRPREALDMIRHARARLLASLEASALVGALEGPSREQWERAVAEYRDARAAIDEDAEGDWKKSRAALDAALLARSSKLAALRSKLDDAMLLIAKPASRPSPRSAGGTLPPFPEEETVLAFGEVAAIAPARTASRHAAREVVGFVIEPASSPAARVTRAYRIGPVDRTMTSERLGELLFGEAKAEIGRAKRLRVIVDGALAWLDVHALPFEGAPLITRAPVVYGADLALPASPAADKASADAGARRVALIVSDPTGDLPSARKEGEAVKGVLGEGPNDLRVLVGRDATAARVREELRGAELFHYAGHGIFRGREGSESALPLAQGGSLTLGDVLTLAHAPAAIVLSGCEAGRQQDSASEGAANMAQAFLVAGASIVVAPVRVVEDDQAANLAAMLHRHARPGADFSDALREAQLTAIREHRPGWDAFRAFVR